MSVSDPAAVTRREEERTGLACGEGQLGLGDTGAPPGGQVSQEQVRT